MPSWMLNLLLGTLMQVRWRGSDALPAPCRRNRPYPRSDRAPHRSDPVLMHPRPRWIASGLIVLGIGILAMTWVEG
jgi:hypothetical protein